MAVLKGQGQRGSCCWSAVLAMCCLLSLQLDATSAQAPVTYFQEPSGCSDGTCNYQLVGTVNTTAQLVEFVWTTMQPANTWLGLGISADRFMPASDIILGYYDGTQGFIQDRYAATRAAPPLDTDQDQVNLIDATSVGGVTTIRFTRTCTSTDTTEDIGVEGSHYFLFAYGSYSNGVPAYHGQAPSRGVSSSQFTISCASPTTAAPNPTTAAPTPAGTTMATGTPMVAATTQAAPATTQPVATTYFQQPSGCSDGTCDYQLVGTVNTTSQRVEFVWTTRQAVNTWLGLGISANRMMPASDIILGYYDGTQGFVQDRYATARAAPPLDADQSQVSLIDASSVGGVTTIRFSRTCTSTDDRDVGVEGSHHFLFAYGPYTGMPGVHTFRASSTDPFTISCSGSSRAGNTVSAVLIAMVAVVATVMAVITV